MPVQTDPLDRECFLHAPAFLRLGPRVLVVAWLVLAGVSVSAAFWRTGEMRHDTQPRTTHTAHTLAEQLRQVSLFAAARSTAGTDAALLVQQLKARLLPEPVRGVGVFDASLRPLAVTGSLAFQSPQPTLPASAPDGDDGLQWQAPAPESKSPLLPITFRHQTAQGDERLVVFALDASALAHIPAQSARNDLGQKGRTIWLATAALVLMAGALTGLGAMGLHRFAHKEAYLRRLASVDALTGLPNRRSFASLLRDEVQRARRTGCPLALFYIDLDNFKAINDGAGHTQGDELLQHVAVVLRRTLPATAHVCRIGGDEFTVVLPAAGNEAGAKDAADRLLGALKAPVTIGGVQLQVRASVGIALLPEHADDIDDLMRFADTAMYEAKATGRGHSVVYSEQISAQSMFRARLVQDLEHALQQEHGLRLVYQPKHSLHDGAVMGYEALMRWQHPVHGAVPPGDFIPMAEQAGLIGDLGAWALRQVARQLRLWHQAGSGWHKVAVNVSPLQIHDDNFALSIKQVLDAEQVPGECLQVELTESTLAANPKLVGAAISRLRQLGVSVAVDDFGTGYSCLASLQMFELDLLKLDKRFVAQVHTRAGAEICRAVISLGHALKLQVIAEGVETSEQLCSLVNLGCDEVQGFLLGRPMPADDAVKAVRADINLHLNQGVRRLFEVLHATP